MTQKSEAELAWDEIRREVTYRFNLAAANLKARGLNEVLPALQAEFDQALNEGNVLTLAESRVWNGDVKELLSAAGE